MQFKEQAYAKPDYQLTVNGRDISRAIKADARLISLTLTESRGDEADQLDIELDESDGALDPEKKIQFTRMKREVLKLGGYRREFFISHSEAVQGCADAVIDMEAFKK